MPSSRTSEPKPVDAFLRYPAWIATPDATELLGVTTPTVMNYFHRRLILGKLVRPGEYSGIRRKTRIYRRKDLLYLRDCYEQQAKPLDLFERGDLPEELRRYRGDRLTSVVESKYPALLEENERSVAEALGKTPKPARRTFTQIEQEMQELRNEVSTLRSTVSGLSLLVGTPSEYSPLSDEEIESLLRVCTAPTPMTEARIHEGIRMLTSLTLASVDQVRGWGRRHPDRKLLFCKKDEEAYLPVFRYTKRLRDAARDLPLTGVEATVHARIQNAAEAVYQRLRHISGEVLVVDIDGETRLPAGMTATDRYLLRRTIFPGMAA